MNAFRIICAGLLTAIAASAIGAGNVRLAQSESPGVQRAVKREAEAKARVAAIEQATRYIRSDDLERAWPAKYARPSSSWQAGEKAFYEEMLAKGQFDILIVPFQVQAGGLDRATRSLMTAQLALAVSSITGASVPDPYLVARALGDGERRFSPAEVNRFADRLGVRRIIWGYVGHYERRGKMRLTIQEQDRLSSAAAVKTAYEEELPYSDEEPPLELYQQLLPAVLKGLELDPSALPAPRHVEGTVAGELPASPLALTSASEPSAKHIYAFQLLAALTPENAERTRERFSEKALLSVLSISPTSPNYNVLKSRAYFQLGLRAAALKTLGSANTLEARHVRAMLNGNRPEAESLAPKVGRGVKALIAHLEVNTLRSHYGANTRDKAINYARSMKLPGSLWEYVAVRAFTDWDSWVQYDNVALKRVLETELPLPAFAMDELGRGALGDVSKLEAIAHFSVLDHVKKLLDSDSETLCCRRPSLQPGRVDYLDLIAAVAIDNLARQAGFLTNIQRAPQQALQYVARMESAFKDHPQFTVARAEAEAYLAAQSTGAAHEGLSRSANMHAFNAWYWEQGQTRTGARALAVIQDLGRIDMGFFDNLYVGDYPYRPFYPVWQRGFHEALVANALRQLSNSSFDASPVDRLARLLEPAGEFDKLEGILNGLSGRFIGEALVPMVLAKLSAIRGETKAAEGHYRNAITVQPDNWDPYLELGRLLVEDAAVEEAAAVFRSYPGFKNPSAGNAVGVSNAAFDAGSLLYFAGHLSLAIPLYKIAADLDTGSGGSLTSAIRLALVKGDYPSALTRSLERAQRYNSTHAYRDYVGMLHAMGHERDAWDAFNTLIAQVDSPHVWETALVGHRRSGSTEAQIISWSSQPAVRGAGRIFDYAGMYVLRAAVTDRTPSRKLASSIEQMERPVWKMDTGLVVRSSADGRIQRILGPFAVNEGSTLQIGVFQNSPKTRVKSDLVHFAEGYRAIREKDFGAATAIFAQAVALYDMTNTEVGYLLPYYAFASAQAGDFQTVQAVLDKFQLRRRRFDYHLAVAALEGVRGKPDASLQSLKLALHRRPFTENRPLHTEYQFAEICEWLYDATGDRRYLEIALDWARKYQELQPWFAWPYAMEARLSADSPRRQRAMAMAYYLDPHSERLAALPGVDVKAAVNKFSATNPFSKKAASPDGRT
jgi:hypothetical protein